MDFDTPTMFLLMRTAAALGVLAAVFFSYRLYRETDKGWYWGTLVLSALFFALSQWVFVLFPIARVHGPGPGGPGPGPMWGDLALLRDVCEILAPALFAISCYGIYKTMHAIRKRVE
ncbi:Uncharacterised protein [Candidatus Gugararchaeum adminiculabundum]|nr:Uncharacterised protein [Candidatus Gugararchaeum adminiculabundum]